MNSIKKFYRCQVSEVNVIEDENLAFLLVQQYAFWRLQQGELRYQQALKDLDSLFEG